MKFRDRIFFWGLWGDRPPGKKLTAKVHPKYVKSWGVQIANTRIAFLFADAFCVKEHFELRL